MAKKSVLFLSIANIFLLALGWAMAIFAYPRLPLKMPLWINFLNQPTLYMQKSALFFLYPLVQLLFCVGFWSLLNRKGIDQTRNHFPHDTGMKNALLRLRKEYVLLALIFFNLIFIHLQRSLILLSHGIEKGVSEYYFFSLFGIILILIPYYRIRKRMIVKGWSTKNM